MEKNISFELIIAQNLNMALAEFHSKPSQR